MVEKTGELLKQEESMLRLTKMLEEYEAGGDQKHARIQELQMEIQDIKEEYEQNKKDLYEQLDQKD